MNAHGRVFPLGWTESLTRSHVCDERIMKHTHAGTSCCVCGKVIMIAHTQTKPLNNIQLRQDVQKATLSYFISDSLE